MNSASLCSLAGRYDNPIPTRCLAPIDCLKIPALYDNPIPSRFLAPVDCYKIPETATTHYRRFQMSSFFPTNISRQNVSFSPDCPRGWLGPGYYAWWLSCEVLVWSGHLPSAIQPGGTKCYLYIGGPNGNSLARCHFRAQKSFDFQGPTLRALVMDIARLKIIMSSPIKTTGTLICYLYIFVM